MTIVEIKSLENGAHRNQTGENLTVYDGWAVVPDEIETPNFPFGDIEVEEKDGVMTVTKWIAGTVPKFEENEKPISKLDQLRADIDYLALMTEVEL